MLRRFDTDHQIHLTYSVVAASCASMILVLMIMGQAVAALLSAGVILAANRFALHISDRERSQAISPTSRRQSARLFSHSLNLPDDAVVTVADDGRIVSFNDAAEALFGYAAEDILGQSLGQLLPPGAAMGERQHFQALMQKNPAELPAFIQHIKTAARHGEIIFPVETFVSSIAQDDGTTITAIFRDISQRVADNEALQQYRDGLRATINYMPLLVHALDAEGRIIFWNQECQRLTGYSTDEILNNPDALALLFPDAAQRAALMAYWRGRSDDYQELLVDVTCKDGSQRTISWSNVANRVTIPGWDSWSVGIDVTERIQTEKARQEREDQYRTLVNDSPIPILVHSGGIIRFVNPAAVTLFGGQNEDDLVGKSVLSIAHPNYTATGEERILKVYAKEGHAPMIEGKFVRLDGEPVDVELMGSMINFNGAPASQVVFHDITQRKAAEAALRESRARLSNAQRIANMGHWEWDIKQDRIFWSDEMFRIFDMEPHDLEITFDTVLRTAHPDDRESLQSTVQAVFDHDMPYIIEHRVILPDGHVRVLHSEGELQRDARGKPDRLIGISHDITERKQVEEALWEEALRNEQILQTTMDGYILADLEGRIVDVNPAFCDMVDYVRDELITMSIWNLAIDVAPDDFAQRLQMVVSQGATRMSVKYRRKDGTERDLDLSITRMHHSAEQVLLVVFLRDITELRQMQNQIFHVELQQMELEKEKEIIKLKEQFISMVSHEFRTPLTVIVSSGDMIENYFDRLTRESTLKHLGKIKSQALFMARLLDDVLMFSKGSAGKLEFNPELLDLDAFCGEIHEQILPLNNANHVIVFDHDDVGEVYLDPKLLKHILTNLVSNAFKYSPPGSTVQCSLKSKNGAVVYCVRDEGIGIPETDQARLFEPFHRAGNVMNVSGTGLGLAIVKNCVDMHGGTITCDSQPGKGTAFTVELPTHPPAS